MNYRHTRTMHRILTMSLATGYWFAMIGLLGGIGVMASGAAAPARDFGSGIGLALLLILQG